MDSISGISPINMPIFSAGSGDAPDNVDMASAKLILDAQKSSGQQIVKMLENLGNNIDIYA